LFDAFGFVTFPIFNLTLLEKKKAKEKRKYKKELSVKKEFFLKKTLPGYIHSLLHITLVTKDVHPKQFGS